MTWVRPALNKINFHDGIQFLDTGQTSVMARDFERVVEDIARAHQKAIIDTGAQDMSQANVVDQSNSIARYLSHAEHPSLAAATEISLSDPGFAIVAKPKRCLMATAL